MDFLVSKTLFYEKYRYLINEIRFILEKYKIDGPSTNLKERQGLSFNDLYNILTSRNISVTEEELRNVLAFLHSNENMILRKNYFSQDPEYFYLDKSLWRKSHGLETYLEDDCTLPASFLLISDTHIEEENFYSGKLLNNIYEYGRLNDVTVVFHLGDLHKGFPNLEKDDYKVGIKPHKLRELEKEFHPQLETFIKEYPNPREIRTFAIMGNKDEKINSFLKSQLDGKHCDLRKLSMYKPNFFMFPGTSLDTTINNIPFHFEHRFSMGLLRGFRMSEFSDIDKRSEQYRDIMLDCETGIYVYGHLHRAFIYSAPNKTHTVDNLYLECPSTSLINKNRAVAYMIHTYPNEKCLEVVVLGCDNNLKIYEIDRIVWNLNSRNKTYKKEY